MMSAETLGERISRLRKERKVTVTTLARAAGLHPGTINKLRSGERESTTFEAGLPYRKGTRRRSL